MAYKVGYIGFGGMISGYHYAAVTTDELVARGIEWCRWLDAQA